MRQLRSISLLLVLAFLATACGARLSEDVRAVAIEGITTTTSDAGAQPVAADQPAADQGIEAVAAPDPAADGTAPGPATDTPGTDQPADQPVAQQPTTSDPGQQQPTQEQPAQEQPAQGPCAPQPVDEPGITMDKIVVANVSDISGAVPGLFEEAQLATKAALAEFNATKGTICGRRIEFLGLDAKMDTNANRTAYLEACQQAWVAVGSMSAFDAGVTPALNADDCSGFPDLRTTALTPQLQLHPQAWPADSMTPWVQPITEYRHLSQKFPGAGDNAAYLRIEGEVTKFQTQQVMEATERALGFNWTVIDIQVAESNYSAFVIELKRNNVTWVSFQGAYQQAIRLAQAMRQQNYWPEVYLLQANVYTPDFLELGGDSIEDAYVQIVSVMGEEVSQHPELQKYSQWVQQVKPGARATALGAYGWSITKLFLQEVEKLGPAPTRAKLIEAMSRVRAWDGFGIHPPQDIGGRTPSDCMIVLQVRGGKFTRVHPAGGGFDCGSGAVDTRDLH